MPSDRWGEVNLLYKCQLLRFGSEGVLNIFSERICESLSELINYTVTKVFVEQPWLHGTVNALGL